jgi:hypothetical protein
MKLWQTLTTATLSLFALNAHADILFLDVNNSGKEIEAAQKAAIARGEKSLRHIKEGFLKPNVYAPKGTTLKLPDNESLCCTPRPDRG